MKGNNKYLFIDKNGKIVLEVIAFTKDEAIHIADNRGIKGNRYVEVKRRKAKNGI